MGHQHTGSVISAAPPTTRPSRSAAVTALGLITLLLGGAYAALGGRLISDGVSSAGRAGADPWGPIATLFGLGPVILVAVGAAIVPLGLLGLLAGSGALLRKQWGRVLTFVLAGLAILLGLVWVGGGDRDATDIAIGAPQVLYGILAPVILTL